MTRVSFLLPQLSLPPPTFPFPFAPYPAPDTLASKEGGARPSHPHPHPFVSVAVARCLVWLYNSSSPLFSLRAAGAGQVVSFSKAYRPGVVRSVLGVACRMMCAPTNVKVILCCHSPCSLLLPTLSLSLSGIVAFVLASQQQYQVTHPTMLSTSRRGAPALARQVRTFRYRGNADIDTETPWYWTPLEAPNYSQLPDKYDNYMYVRHDVQQTLAPLTYPHLRRCRYQGYGQEHTKLFVNYGQCGEHERMGRHYTTWLGAFMSFIIMVMLIGYNFPRITSQIREGDDKWWTHTTDFKKVSFTRHNACVVAQRHLHLYTFHSTPSITSTSFLEAPVRTTRPTLRTSPAPTRTKRSQTTSNSQPRSVTTEGRVCATKKVQHVERSIEIARKDGRTNNTVSTG